MKKDKAKDAKRRVVVTGLGVISSIGIGVEDFWKNLIAGKSGISEIESFDTSAYPVHKGGEVKNFKPQDFIDKRKLKYLGRASQMAIAATKLAIDNSGLRKRDFHRVGVLLGTTMGESPLLEEMDSCVVGGVSEKIASTNIFLFPMNVVPVAVAIEFKACGYNFMIPNACSAGNFALGYGFDLISKGVIDVVFCGGSDALARTAFTGFNRLLVMSSDKCQPFDKNRKGMMLGEGAGILILESLEHARKRGAKIYAEVLGYGLSCDARHMTQPSVDGIVRSLRKALSDADVCEEAVDYINAHGTGTIQNDKVESLSLREVFSCNLDNIPCSSIKSMLGHTMGSASAIEAIATSLAVKTEIMPPTINLETVDPECNIDCIPNIARRKISKVALSNSYAFGGNNAVIVFGKI